MYEKRYSDAFKQAVTGIAHKQPELLEVLKKGPRCVTLLELQLRTPLTAQGDLLEKHRAALAQASTNPELAMQVAQALTEDLEYLAKRQMVHRQCEALVPPIYRPIR